LKLFVFALGGSEEEGNPLTITAHYTSTNQQAPWFTCEPAQGRPAQQRTAFQPGCHREPAISSRFAIANRR
jgi:hypothetical protein